MWNGLRLLTFPFRFDSGTRDSGPRQHSGTEHLAAIAAKALRVVTAEPADIRLVTRVREGTDDEAREVFDDIYARMFESLFRFAFRTLGDPDVAHDVVQDTFVSLWIARHNWYAPSGSKAYLYAAVRNRIVTRIRHTKVRDRADLARIPAPAEMNPPDVSVESIEFHQAFQAALATLSERRRMAFLLYAADGLTYEAIGEVLGISKPAAFKQVMAAIAVLRTKLSQFDG